jgi:hypothetical protein
VVSLHDLEAAPELGAASATPRSGCETLGVITLAWGST